MTDIFGASGPSLRERIGSLAQVIRVDSFVEAEGPARGARRLRLVNGGGIEFEVHPDRALDIGQLTVDSIPISWMSPTTIAAPQFYEPAGAGWMRTFGGGLLATCGLDTFGPPGHDDGDDLGQHGRIGAQPATVTRSVADTDGVVVEGLIRQASVFGENLLLHRRISSAAGSDTVVVEDTVTNEGYADAPHMILYHANLGWPLLDAGTVIDIPSVATKARDADAESGEPQRNEIGAPAPGFREQVYSHDFAAGGPFSARVTNEKLGVEFSLTFSGDTLSFLHQWKMTGQGTYVLGIEPSNCRNLLGRAVARDAGELPILRAGESVHYRIEFRVRRTRPAGSA